PREDSDNIILRAQQVLVPDNLRIALRIESNLGPYTNRLGDEIPAERLFLAALAERSPANLNYLPIDGGNLPANVVDGDKDGLARPQLDNGRRHHRELLAGREPQLHQMLIATREKSVKNGLVGRVFVALSCQLGDKLGWRLSRKLIQPHLRRFRRID